jgi:tRNA A-37 threonylcarbamoyl transferase component Bud32
MIETGTVLQDRFLIEKELARGGMGAVYLATDQKFGSRVAIKERFYEDTQLAEAFAREARILNCLHHPILPHVSDYFSDEDGHFLVMEYIEGEDLSEILKRDGGAFPVADVVRWTLELLDGLDYLHSQDPPIVHRDIKPGNLKLTSRGNIVLLDFGLAKETSGNNHGVRSVFGYSRRYSPLEQIEGAGTDPRSDLFSLGATCFHLLTGEGPVDVLARASAIVAGRPDPLRLVSDINPDVDSETAQVINRALALDPEQRFNSAREMRSALETAVEARVTEHVLPLNAEVAAAWVPNENPAMAPRANSEDYEVTEGFEIDHAPMGVITEPPGSTNAPGAAAVSAAATSITSRRRERSRFVRPFWQTPAFWVAVIVVALTTIGIAFSKFSNRSTAELADHTVATNESAAKAETAPATESPNDDGSSAAEISQAPLPASNTEEDLDQSLTRPPSKAFAESPEAADDDETENDRPVVVDKASPVKNRTRNVQKEVEEENRDRSVQQALPDSRRRASARRGRVTADQPIRRNRPRDDFYEPPISSIEMIFTGIPPERRYRRYRRWQPY